ncbi:SseB protein N-terminal domain-containing protein [Okibacterium fritillariae]|uniref:SseB protein N-terminal domain-containing protein n=2 Tax=Okibacterium fritillariae TaxID=123320 RepID=A0A1T5KSX1_9MICO|nr:SseB protein N-terminal domain-containing protein [Okibacterium fritillariae]
MAAALWQNAVMAKKPSVSFRSDLLAEALEKQDMAQVALALRNDRLVVPLAKPAPRDKPTAPGEVWMYRRPEDGRLALLVFSDAKNKPEALPPFVAAQDGAWLHEFLRVHGDEIETVFFDIAGPHPMQADPAELLRVLDLDGGSPPIDPGVVAP